MIKTAAQLKVIRKKMADCLEPEMGFQERCVRRFEINFELQRAIRAGLLTGRG